MKSKANIKGHPLHPILVAFPIAFFTGAFLSDLILVLTYRTFFGQMAKYLAIGGILFAILAAIAGIVDYLYSVPPKSSAKKRATKHGLLNTGVLLLFVAVVLLKTNNAAGPVAILLLEGAGVIVLTIAGWLGGTLVYRNQIGVDHRYAGAGKWQEETIGAEDRIELKGLDKLAVNQMKLLHAGGRRIVIGRTETGIVAFDDFCTHRGGSLADGAMICGTVQCPWHGSQFDVHTGAVHAGPAGEPIKTYAIENSGERFFLRLPAAPADR